MTHRYIRANGRFWVTTRNQRKRVIALRDRPKSWVIISGDGTELGPDRTVTIKTTCTVHDDRETLEWFYDQFTKELLPGMDDAQQMMKGMLDTPRRVVLELEPAKYISYDGDKLNHAIADEGLD